MEIVHAVVRRRTVGKGLVQASTSLAAYPTVRCGKYLTKRPCSYAVILFDQVVEILALLLLALFFFFS
jgi:hypothetical protein